MEEETIVEDNDADTGALVSKPVKKEQNLESSIVETLTVPTPDPEDPV